MSHLIKIYSVCKFSYFHLWYLTSYPHSAKKCRCQNLHLHNLSKLYYKEKSNTKVDRDEVALQILLFSFFGPG